ncbi:hypothetical protein H0N95_00775 [Candidatus Micrarchaeota archaeon]|nr:hypothetical protein [Candidatus Micrarchaeota archaeon]
MKIQILTDKENALLGRRELNVLVKEYGATPDRKEITKALAGELQTSEKNILLDKVNQEYGKHESVCYVKVYNTLDEKKKYETKPKLKKSGEEPAGIAEVAAETKPTKEEKKAASEVKKEIKKEEKE